MNLGLAIKLRRVRKQISQIDLAEIVGISPAYVSLLENNKRYPNFLTLKKVADALDVGISELTREAEALEDERGVV